MHVHVHKCKHQTAGERRVAPTALLPFQHDVPIIGTVMSLYGVVYDSESRRSTISAQCFICVVGTGSEAVDRICPGCVLAVEVPWAAAVQETLKVVALDTVVSRDNRQVVSHDRATVKRLLYIFLKRKGVKLPPGLLLVDA